MEPCGKELGLERAIFSAELMWVGFQCGSPNSCGDAGASRRRRAAHRAGSLLLLLACISFKCLWHLFSLNFELWFLSSCYYFALCPLQQKDLEDQPVACDCLHVAFGGHVLTCI